MEVKADRRVQFIAVRCSAQSSKTQTILCLLCYDISEDPGPTMYVLANQPDAEDFVRDRVSPTFNTCKAVKDALIRETKASFTFTTMPLYFVGAGSDGKLQGKPMKRLYLDEVRNYPKGALPTVMKRVRAFSQLGSQIILISTPGDENDEVDTAFKQGDQRTYHFPCPSCGHMQTLRFAQLKFDTNDDTRPEGQWNFDKLSLTIRYECEKCGHKITDTPAERKMICRSGRFIRMNPNAPANHVSFTWNALLPWWVPWRSIVEEFLTARGAARNGDTSKMRTFVTETLGEPWKDQLGVIEDFGFLEARKGGYEFGEIWPEETKRFMFADAQEAGGEHYWWVVRAFASGGKSRLVAYGKALSLAELEEKRELWKVPIANAMIDTGYKANDLYRFCLSTGWKAFKGEPKAEYFLHKISVGPGKFKMVRRFWECSRVDPFLGKRGQGHTKPLRLYRHIGDLTKDSLAEYMTGLVGEWTLPKEVGKDYMEQLTGERRVEVKNENGIAFKRAWKRVGPNHLLDCELGIHVAATITKTIAEKGEEMPPAKT